MPLRPPLGLCRRVFYLVALIVSAGPGTFALSIRENDPADLTKDWDLFAVQIAVRF